MANLIYLANTSLDGYTEDKDGKFDWTTPDEEILQIYQQPRTGSWHLSLRTPNV